MAAATKMRSGAQIQCCHGKKQENVVTMSKVNKQTIVIFCVSA
jgi:hypothetical protein